MTYFAKAPLLDGETITSPTQAMGSVNRASLLTPKIIQGIQEIAHFVKQEFTAPTNDQLTIVRLGADYKGLAMISPINPLQRVLVDALAHIIGLPETPSMQALRFAMHPTGQNAHKEHRLLAHLKDSGISGTDMMTCMRALRDVRHLIPNHGNLARVKSNQERNPQRMMTPH